MRAERLLSALLLLQGHGRLSGRELARRLEVSTRTVHRDMEALGAAGVPVYAVRGSRGGWQLDEDWRTRVPGLDDSELRALLMAQPRALGDARLVRAAERALDKLMAALPVSMREQAAAMRQRLHVDTTGWHGTPENLAMLPIVQEAVARDKKLSMRYAKAGRERVDRTVDPLGLVAKGAAWYLVAASPNGLRTYRVSRIESARLLAEPSERPTDFDLAAYWKSSTEEFLKNRTRYDVTLHLDPGAAEQLAWFRPTSPVPASGPDSDGWVLKRVSFEDEAQAAFVVMGLGRRVDVIEPRRLRERVAADRIAAADRSIASSAPATCELRSHVGDTRRSSP